MKNITTIFDEDTEEEIKLPLKNEICYRCDGEGVHVNPSIDGSGICASDEIWQDDDFRETYFGGGYDIVCEICHGNKVIKVVDETRLSPETLAKFHAEQHAIWDDEAMMAAERAAGA